MVQGHLISEADDPKAHFHFGLRRVLPHLARKLKDCSVAHGVVFEGKDGVKKSFEASRGSPTLPPTPSLKSGGGAF